MYACRQEFQDTVSEKYSIKKIKKNVKWETAENSHYYLFVKICECKTQTFFSLFHVIFITDTVLGRVEAYCLLIFKYRKKEPLKKAQNIKITNVAGSVWLSLFMDGSVKRKLP